MDKISTWKNFFVNLNELSPNYARITLYNMVIVMELIYNMDNLNYSHTTQLSLHTSIDIVYFWWTAMHSLSSWVLCNAILFCNFKANNIKDSINTLRNSIKQIENRETHVEKKIKKCYENAKAKSKQKDKKGALFELKKKKQLEKQLTALQNKKY